MIRPLLLAALMLTLAPNAFAQPRNQQRPDGFVDVGSVAPGLIVEMRYATAHNFVGVPMSISLPSARRGTVRSAVEPREWPERAAI